MVVIDGGDIVVLVVIGSFVVVVMVVIECHDGDGLMVVVIVIVVVMVVLRVWSHLIGISRSDGDDGGGDALCYLFCVNTSSIMMVVIELVLHDIALLSWW